MCRAPTIPFKRGGWPLMGALSMDFLKLLPLVMFVGVFQNGWAQSPNYGLGKTPAAEEIRAWDISIGPEGKELPPGRGTAAEGAKLFLTRGCGGCHGPTGIGARAPALIKGGPERGQPIPPGMEG